MNVQTFRNMQVQLVQMLVQRPSLPGFPSGKFRAYLVSNGQFNEEVQVAAREMNDAAYPANLELWSRGTLLDLCKRHASSLWPSEIQDTRALLELYMANSRDPLRTKTLNELLSSILAPAKGEVGGAELDRCVSSACWATGLSIAKYVEDGNYHAVACGWMLCWSLIKSIQCELTKPRKRLTETLELCEAALFDALAALWHEVRQRNHLGEGNPLVDIEVYPWRISTLVGLLSALEVVNQERRILDSSSAQELEVWLRSSDERPALWGEAAVAQIVPWIIFLVKYGEDDKAKGLLIDLLTAVVMANSNTEEGALPTPHYSYEEVLRDINGFRGAAGFSLRERETFYGNSYVAEFLLRFAIMCGWTSEAKNVWPQYSKLSHRSFEFDKPCDFWRYHCDRGTEVTRIYPETYRVSDIEAEVEMSVVDAGLAQFWPDELWPILMWWQVAPHRLSSAVGCLALRESRSSVGTVE